MSEAATPAGDAARAGSRLAASAAALLALGHHVGRRALLALPTLVLVIVASFTLLKLAPGDLAEAIAGDVGAATPEFMDTLRRQFGLDEPLPVQFGHYLFRLAHLDFGYSFKNGMPVFDLILDRLPATALLTLASMVVALAFGIVIGLAAAYKRGRWPDTVLSVTSTIGFATPLFWVGLMLIFLFSVELRWLPSGGMATTGLEGDLFDRIADTARHLALPVLTLSLFYVSIYARVVRAAVIEVLDAEFVRTAKAKGLGRARIAVRHVLRNALLPLVTVTGLEVGTLLGGTITVETVFSWPGMARLAYEAVTYRDLNLLMGILILSAVLIVAANLVLDALYVLIDPRIAVR
ncbi:ABC transporter permease [Xanthobacter sediminis]